MVRRVLVIDDSATLRKIVRVVLEGAGYEVDTASDGAEGLERVQRARFDAALVDFVMPRLNGYQLTQAIRSIPSLRALPVVLMSAKAEQIGGRFITQTGAVSALTKPFSPGNLLDAVDQAVRSRSDPDADPGVDPGADPGADLGSGHTGESAALHPDADVHAWLDAAAAGGGPDLFGSGVHSAPPFRAPAALRPPSGPSTKPPRPATPQAEVPAGEPPGTPAGVPAEVFGGLARVLLPVVARVVAAGAPVTVEELARALQAGIDPAGLAELAGVAAGGVRGASAGVRGASAALEGAIGYVPLGEVFQLLGLQAQTGLLVIDGQRGTPEVTVAFREGRIDLCVARGLGPEFRLGRYLVADGVVARVDVEAVAARTRGAALLGEALVRGSYLGAEDLARALEHQTSELVYEVLRWGAGQFRFEAGATLPVAQLARLGLAGENLVLEGFRRIDEWRLIAEYLPSERTVLSRHAGLMAAVAAERLDRDERRVLDAVDGVRAVRDVVSTVGLSAFDTCKILYRLVRARLVAPVAA